MQRIDPLVGDAWDSAVLAHPNQTVFHRSAWARVLTETYGHRPFYLRFEPCVTGRRGVSLPFSDSAGPLWGNDPNHQEIYAKLTEIGAAENWRWLEIRDDRHPPLSATPSATYETHSLDLRPGIDVLEQNLAPAVRRALRKAAREDLEISIETSSRAVAEFYALHGRTRRRHGLPPQPAAFFDAIANHLIAHNLGFVVLARNGGKPIAGAVFLQSGQQAIYKFGASDSEFWHLRPNQPVMWAAIRHLATASCQSLTFGRTAPADDGLRRFKLSWGSTCRPLCYYRHRNGSWKSPSRELKESQPHIFSRLPLSLNRLAGRLLYPHLD